MRNGRITQQEVEGLLVISSAAHEAKVEAEKLKAEVDLLESGLIARLQEGLRVERGLYGLLLDTSEVRSVAWRQVVERELGKAFAETELAQTPPRAKTLMKVVQEVDGRANGHPSRREEVDS